MVSSRPMILVGLTGGVATGKSTVAKMFERCGALVIDADALAHQVVEPGKPAWRAIVFRNRSKLRRLEQIIHPRVAREQTRLTRQAARNDPKAIVIYDVPLLYEAGIDKRVDKVIVVTADRETQITRLNKRNGFTRAEALRRIRSQMPIKQKAAAADYLLDGTTPRPRLLTLVKRLYRELHTLA